MKNFIIFITLFLVVNAHADTCWENFKERTESLMDSRELQYRLLDLKFSNLTDKAEGYAAKGKKNELVFLIHGFLGNPNELKSVADMLNRAGYSVYSGLIPGYGATAKVANFYTKDHWLRWNAREIKRAEKCFSKIHLVGFSTGGTIIHDYVTTHPEVKKIASVTLISAFFQNHPEFNIALKAAKTSGVREIELGWVLQHVPVADARVIVDTPDTYLQTAPILSMFEVIELGKINRDRRLAKQINVPVNAIISMEDWVSDPNSQLKVLKKNFSDLELRTYYRPGHVPHQLMAESVSQVADQVHMAIIDFIKRN